MATHYAHIPASSSVQVSTEAGVLSGIFSGGGTPPIDIYDTNNGTTSGTKILRVPASGENPFALDFPEVEFLEGLYVVTNSVECTVFYI